MNTNNLYTINLDINLLEYNDINYEHINRLNDYIYYNVINNNMIYNYLYQDIIIQSHNIEFTTDTIYIGETCSICVECVENVETMAVTKCQHKPHVFHKACISKWTEKSHKCPNCRQDMS
jgi:hypothetical protein